MWFSISVDTFEIVVDEDGKVEFTIPHHYESNVKAAGEVNNPARARRLAQEAVTLSTSLPLSAGSSVFVRCDEERLDVMKVFFRIFDKICVNCVWYDNSDQIIYWFN